MSANYQSKSSSKSRSSKEDLDKFDILDIPYASIQPTFDYYLVADYFPTVNNTSDLDFLLEDVIKSRLNEITPRSEELSNLTSTVSKLLIIIDKLKASPGSIDACKIDDGCMVGSLRMGTIVKGHRVADLVVTLRTLPVKAAVSALGNKILEELQRIEPTNPFQINSRDDFLELTNLFNRDVVRILVATNYHNLKKLNREIHVKKCSVQKNLIAIHHAKWFEDNVKSNDIKNLIRLFKDVCLRFKEFSYFTPWMIIVLCHYCITRTKSGHHLPIHVAFKRIFQLLSSGIFLPYSSGIIDPCEPKMPIHGKLSVHDQETITRHAQSLLRVLNYRNGYKYLFGLETMGVDITESVTYWDNVFFVPSVSVFEEKKKSTDSPSSN